MNADGRASRPPLYRYRTAALVGPWRWTRDVAKRDAVKARQAFVDKSSPEGIQWRLPGTIEEDGAEENDAGRRSPQPGDDR